MGTQATVLCSDSSPKSSQWHFGSWKQPVVTWQIGHAMRRVIGRGATEKRCLSEIPIDGIVRPDSTVRFSRTL